ncbi:MAG: hypothetical protein QW594_01115 [Candidatus Woesearchaeota archaeon]
MFLELFGTYGYAQAGIMFVEPTKEKFPSLEPTTNSSIILRINNRWIAAARATLLFINQEMHTCKVSGTLAGIKKKRRAQRKEHTLS